MSHAQDYDHRHHISPRHYFPEEVIVFLPDLYRSIHL